MRLPDEQVPWASPCDQEQRKWPPPCRADSAMQGAEIHKESQVLHGQLTNMNRLAVWEAMINGPPALRSTLGNESHCSRVPSLTFPFK